MKKRVLVIGGAGYIGSLLAGKILKNGNELIIIDNFMYNQHNSLNHLMSYKNLKIVQGDFRDISLIKKYVEKSDIVIPLAAIVGAPACSKNPEIASAINFEAPKNLFNVMANNQVLIMPTTNSAYGTTPKGQITDELSPLNPISQYAIEKVKVETLLLNRNNSVSLRLATVFGVSPRMRIDLLVNDLVYKAVKDKFLLIYSGNARRNYIHVRDVSSIISQIIESPDKFIQGKLFNVGLSSANLTKTQLAELIKSKLPGIEIIEDKKSEDPDQRDYLVSNAKIEKLGVNFEYTLEQGIEELIKFYQILPNFTMGNI